MREKLKKIPAKFKSIREKPKNFEKQPVTSNKKIKKEDYLAALERLKKSPKDRIGTLSEIGITWAGATAGFVSAGAIASAAGVSTLLGSSTLAGILGGVFVTSTPIGWLIGGAVLAGGTAYGLTKLLRSSAKADEEKLKNITAIETKLSELNKTQEKHDTEKQMTQLIECLQRAVELEFSQEKSNKILVSVFNRKMRAEKAIDLVMNYVNSMSHEKT
ncbi:hypothetical protein [Thiomicrorhabdus sp. Milos-T2]|uniref:hypothetical protein n=1 Tax=Thiomicrorhabdus sp. Milos-T2 TaxID=90814 RepID=UPI00049431A4|nr:hypothetical protein [Thiomicrorhabdus sp. Milos-T2]